jgi:hypothetical protein
MIQPAMLESPGFVHVTRNTVAESCAATTPEMASPTVGVAVGVEVGVVAACCVGAGGVAPCEVGCDAVGFDVVAGGVVGRETVPVAGADVLDGRLSRVGAADWRLGVWLCDVVLTRTPAGAGTAALAAGEFAFSGCGETAPVAGGSTPAPPPDPPDPLVETEPGGTEPIDGLLADLGSRHAR